MAKIFENGKWKKKTLTALSVVLAGTLSLGVFSACTTTEPEEETESKVAPTDTQLIKNGNFEFYSDKLVDPDDNGKPLDKHNIISTPDSWSFTSGSPSSNTKSGVIDTADWNYFTKTGGYSFKTFTKGEGDDAKEVTTFETIEEAYAHWEDANVSAYDRLKFLDIFSDEIDDLADTSEQAKLFSKYSYSVDFEDVEKFNDEDEGVSLGTSGNVFELHDGATDGEGNENNTSVLMIHNQRTADDGVRGTAQYYTSSTTVTLSAGTAAEVSVWVRTDALYHYKDTELTQRGGAYIGVTNTVGGSTLDQMQIYNIHTDGKWQKYTIYVRASTFATSTFRIVLGLGQGSSDDKYYAVDGYAFFDDVTCKLISREAYDEAVHTENGVKEGVKECTVDSLKAEKQFDSDVYPYADFKTFALDLYAPIDGTAVEELTQNATVALTEEVSGSNTYTSEKIDASRGDSEENVKGLITFDEIKNNTSNKYLRNIYTNDFENKFPFDEESSKVIMLMSANGAAYTAKLAMPEGKDPATDESLFKLAPDSRILISFFVKTSKIRSGLTGASAALVDGENKTYISPFDSTTLAAVDIDSKSDDESLKDIYKGWTQCFFFVENDTETDKVFSLEFSYGPTTIVGTNKFSYGEGYAAFTGFEVKPLTKTEYGYASTGDRAKKVSLTGEVEETKRFDSVSATAEEDLKTGPALPANFRGALGGSDFVQKNDTSVPNVKPANVSAGLVSSKYAENYFKGDESWKQVLAPAAGDAANETEWWTNLFGNSRQPLVIVNGEAAAYGFYAETESVSASSYRRISMRVKASKDAKVNLYLIDTTADETGTLLRPDLPAYTYWYDDEGNIVNMDPSADDYKTKGEVLFELQPNGLYKKAEDDGKFYANLRNFDKDDEGNLVTKDGTIAYFYNVVDKQFYAYREEDAKTGVYTYNTVVTELPAENLRYDNTSATKSAEARIELTGTGEWMTMSFYLHTGDEEKSYRLEVWSGSRDGATKNPANSYVFFDNYSSSDATSDFDTLRDDAIKGLKEKLNEGKEMGSEGYLGNDDLLPEAYAGYYTFTFFDSKDYLRYDETTDEEELGDPYYSYVQSSNEEQVVWLRYEEAAAKGQSARYSFYLDYSASDVTVEREYPDTDSDDTDTDTDHTHDTGTEATNIWLLIASGSLAIVLVFAIAAVIVRRILKNRSKRTRIKAQKDKRVRPAKPSDAPAPEDGNEA